MRTLKFYGSSDDLFECEDSTGNATEEIGCYGDIIGAYIIASADKSQAMHVTAVYGNGQILNGIWSIGVGPFDEGFPFPDWKMTFSINKKGYSSVLTIEVPDDSICLPAKQFFIK